MKFKPFSSFCWLLAVGALCYNEGKKEGRMNEYIKLVEERLQKIETTQAERIERAGQLLTAAIAQDRLI